MARQRIQVYLFDRKRLMGGKGSDREVVYYMLRWRSAIGRERSEGIGKSSEMTKTEARRKRAEKEDSLNRDVAERLPDRDDLTMTLGELLEMYPEQRARGDASLAYQALKDFRPLSEGTLRGHCMALRYLIEHFGADCRLSQIAEPEVLKWHRRLYEGKLSAARTNGWGEKGGEVKRLSTNTVRSYTRSVKAVFRWAKRMNLVRFDPFEGLIGSGVPGKDCPYIPIEDFRALCDAVPPERHGWVVLFALCRLAGLRCDEALTLPWSGKAEDKQGQVHRVGVQWPAVVDGIEQCGRLLVCSTKTHMYREVPICAELLRILRLAEVRAASEADRLCAPNSGNNLPREIKKYQRLAGLAEWRAPYQSLRVSLVNDWKSLPDMPESSMLRFVGHTMEVSRKHYQRPSPDDFNRVGMAG